MRPVVLASLLALAVAPPALAQGLPEGVEHLLTCGTVFSLRSEEAKAAGDEDGATEFFHMGDNLIWQARTTLEGAGYLPDAVDDALMNSALVIGFRYGAGEDETMLADCLAALDSP